MYRKSILFVLVTLALAGCSVAPVAPAANAPAAKAGTYYFLAANNADPFYVTGLAGFKAAAAELGVKTDFVGPMDLNLAEQIKTFEGLVANPDTQGILLYAMDFNATEPMVKDAEAKGIPVVIGAADSPFKTRTAFVGYDNASLGQQAAEFAVKAIGGKGKVGSIGVTGPGVTQRRAAFEKQIKDNYPAVEVVPTASHDGSATSAAATLDAYLQAHPDLTLVWWADGMAGQMVQPWKEKQAAGVKTLFLGMDMPMPTLQAVADGVFVGSIGQDTYSEEYWALKLLEAKRNGKRVPDSIYLRALILDKANVGEFLVKK